MKIRISNANGCKDSLLHAQYHYLQLIIETPINSNPSAMLYSPLQAAREALFLTIKLQGEIRNVVGRKHFLITPLLLIYLGEDQKAFDYILRVMLYHGKNQRRTIDNLSRLLPITKFLGKDRSHGINLMGLMQSYGTPFYHYVVYLIVKIHYLHHLMNVQAMYTLLWAINTASSSARVCDSNAQTVKGLSDIAGNQHVLFTIRSFLLDSRNLPTSQFEIRDPIVIREQIAKAFAASDEEHYGNIWDKVLQGCRKHEQELQRLKHAAQAGKGKVIRQRIAADIAMERNPMMVFMSMPEEFYEDDDSYLPPEYDAEDEEDEVDENVLEAIDRKEKRLLQDLLHAVLLQPSGSPLLLTEIAAFVNSNPKYS